jgi:protein-S-isoprenylcysteine O-methyltransferase Ste14
MHYIRTLAWLVCGAYATIPLFWLIIHPFADFWRKHFRAPLKVVTPVWIFLWILTWIATYPWRDIRLVPYPYREAIGWGFPSGMNWLSLLAIPCWALTLYIYFGGTRQFSFNQVIGRSELESDRHEQRLVTTGLHSRIRHPLYFGHLCTMLGWLALAQTRAVLALLVWGIATGALMIRTEDAELERRFGSAFRDYRKRVPAVIPRL